METLLPLFGFVFVGTVTPGPNNIMVLASGANWGYRRTVPHILGVTVGFPAMLIAVGLGLGVVFERYPDVHTVLKVAAFAYLLWLAWRIATAARPEAEGGAGRPLSFLQAAAFQWVNPKAWALAFGAVSLFTTPGGDHPFEVGLIAGLFGAVCFPGLTVWCLFGTAIARFLADDARRQRFNRAMAIVLVASTVPTML